MTWHVVPAVKAALAEASERWPKRNCKSDGTIGDAAHSNRASDHNPDERGAVLAFDLTSDPESGCDAHKLVREAVARGDKRIRYAITNGRIWSRARRKEGWRPYSGSNDHTLHAHVSVERRYENDTSPWWASPEPAPAPKPAVVPPKRPVVPPKPPADLDGADVARLPVLRQGSRGQAVRNLQGLLLAAGRRVTVDGHFGPGTRAALIEWQRAAKAPGGADGVAGPGTWGRLLGLR